MVTLGVVQQEYMVKRSYSRAGTREAAPKCPRAMLGTKVNGSRTTTLNFALMD